MQRNPQLFPWDILKGREEGVGPPQQGMLSASAGVHVEWKGSGRAGRVIRNPEEAAEDWERG